MFEEMVIFGKGKFEEIIKFDKGNFKKLRKLSSKILKTTYLGT